MDASTPPPPDPLWLDQPTFAAAFQCIGPACEDHCCGGWDIPLDPATYSRYQQFRSPELARRTAEFVRINPPPQSDGHFARIRQTPSGLCPFFEADRLCAIQAEDGPGLLSASCSIYPRSLSLIGGRMEGALSLSCPEAARNILLQPDFMQQTADLDSGAFRTDNVYLLDGDSPAGNSPEGAKDFRAIRRAMIELVRDRRRPLPDRLLLLGRLCEQLEALGNKTEHAAMLEVVRRFEVSDALREPNEAIPDPSLLLDVVFALTEVLVQDGSELRFQETFLDFVQGISAAPDAPAGSDTDRFLHAERSSYTEFFEAHPYVLENLLTNAMLQTLFPCGRTGSERFDPQSVLGEYLQLVTRFLWLNALLVGVAGRYRERFAGEHVVKTVQAFTRAVEHYPSVLIWMREVMQSRGLHSLQGMTILLRR